ncbi:MAG: hypothetical protein ABIJ04_02020 [Bacteroidota bacterium]
MHRSFLVKIICYSALLALCTTFAKPMQAQSGQAISEAEEKLKQLFDGIMETIDDEKRISSGDQFSALLQQTLTMDESFVYPFPLLPNLSKLTSPEKRFRIYTWNVPLHSGMNRFYGLIQLKSTTKDTTTVIELVDQGNGISNPDEAILTPERWYGAIYYQLIPNQTGQGREFYTLLGWRGENILMTIRLIDILTITPGGEICFGQPLFCQYGETNSVRIIFRHSANVSMSLRYEEQWMVTDKKWNSRHKEFKYTREKTWIIVCDRLVPADPQLENQYENYIPAGDVMDGFLFRDRCWHFIEQIDVRNPGKK